MTELYFSINDAVASGHAAIQLHADLTPINGMDAVIMPGIHIKGNNPSFATHQLRDGTLNVSVQTEQSSARHAKDQIAAMIAERGYQLPSIVADLDGIGQFNALEFAHGIEDAVIRDCRLGDVPFMMSDIGEAIYRSRPRNVSAHYAYYPYSLVYGGWNSHQGQTGYKFPRSVACTIDAYNCVPVPKSGAKSDPLDLGPVMIYHNGAKWAVDENTFSKDEQKRPTFEDAKGKELQEAKDDDNKWKWSRLSEVGYGLIPPSLIEHGGIVAERYTQRGSVNLSLLHRYHMADRTQSQGMRVAVAFLGLLSLRISAESVGFIRSRCGFTSNPVFSFLHKDGHTSEMPPFTDADLHEAIQASMTDVPWNLEPIILTPTEKLRQVIQVSTQRQQATRRWVVDVASVTA